MNKREFLLDVERDCGGIPLKPIVRNNSEELGSDFKRDCNYNEKNTNFERLFFDSL